MASPVTVVRVIARLNVGGPAHHVSILTRGLDPSRYRSILAFGSVGAGEEQFAAPEIDAHTVSIPGLGPEVRPRADLVALRALVRLLRQTRPAILHTHTAKAGLLGRLAAVVAGRPRPIVIHTYHGHVLEGYFGAVPSTAYRLIERGLAQISDRLIAVSQRTVDDLVRLRVAPRERFEHIPLGLELAAFREAPPGAGSSFREDLGLGDDDVLAVYLGRLAPIKRLDVLLPAFAHALAQRPELFLAVVGDGEIRGELERLAATLGVEERVRFTGYRQDLVEIHAATDISVLSSDNEGTPVSLIEAAVAGNAIVATRAGGVEEVLTPGCALLVKCGDYHALGDAIVELARDPERRAELAAFARASIGTRYDANRLLGDIDALYTRLLACRSRPG